ncbi:MAG: GntR family transcriptional regulator [Synergistaceae bacterium]|jgi:DNA-binding GntR family transcriptional regulator|nr:GntR family transcriptional regulator [Synergistaceae bacterium]
MLDEIFGAQEALSVEHLVDRIFNIIENNIIEGKLKPRSLLAEDKLAKVFGTSRSPVREALLRLENIGLVVRTDQNRKIVAPLSTELAGEYYQIWEMVESFAGGLACGTATDRTYLQLESALREMEEISDSDEKDLKRYRHLNYEFHSLFVEECTNQTLLQFYDRAIKSIQWCWNLSLNHKDDVVRSNNEHKQLYAAFKSRDRACFETLLRKHIHDASIRFVHAFKTIPTVEEEDMQGIP